MEVAQHPSLRLRRIALTLTLAVEPTEQHRYGARIESQPMACPRNQSEFGRSVSLGQLPGIDRRHAVVVVAVHHQKGPRRQPAGGVNRAETTQLPSPLIERRRNARCADSADFAGMFEKASRLRSPIVEVGAGAEQRCAAYPRVVGGDTRDHGPTGVAADQPAGPLPMMTHFSIDIGGFAIRYQKRPHIGSW